MTRWALAANGHTVPEAVWGQYSNTIRMEDDRFAARKVHTMPRYGMMSPNQHPSPIHILISPQLLVIWTESGRVRKRRTRHFQ
jgi:hypothetical protein